MEIFGEVTSLRCIYYNSNGYFLSQYTVKMEKHLAKNLGMFD